jgi:hypothetical protein
MSAGVYSLIIVAKLPEPKPRANPITMKELGIDSGVLIYLNDLQIMESQYTTQLCHWFLVFGFAICVSSDKLTAVFSQNKLGVS